VTCKVVVMDGLDIKEHDLEIQLLAMELLFKEISPIISVSKPRNETVLHLHCVPRIARHILVPCWNLSGAHVWIEKCDKHTKW
jgi:hypothetical protein